MVEVMSSSLGTKEVAEIFSVTPQTIREWIRWGALSARRGGRRRFYVSRKSVELLQSALAVYTPPQGRRTRRGRWSPVSDIVNMLRAG